MNTRNYRLTAGNNNKFEITSPPQTLVTNFITCRKAMSNKWYFFLIGTADLRKLFLIQQLLVFEGPCDGFSGSPT